MHYFRKQTVQQDDIWKSFSKKLPSDLQKLKSALKEDERKDIPRKWLDIVLDECIELMNLRQVIKLMGQFKLAIQQGIIKQEEQTWNRQIQVAKKRLTQCNRQLFLKFEPKNQQQEPVSKKPFAQTNSEELSNQFIQLNQTKKAIIILSELIDKALNNQQVHEQLPKIENIIPKETSNMLTLLRNYLDFKKSLEAVKSDFVSKLRKIDQAFLYEKGDLAPFEDNDDSHQISHLYERISAFIDQNQSSLKNLHFFNKDIVDSLRNFICQILQPLQKKKQEEIDVVHILTDISDIKLELQRVLYSYKDYLQENDKNSQEMVVQIERYQVQDGISKKKLQDLQKDKEDNEAQIKRLNQIIKQKQAALDQIKKRLAQLTQAHQLCSHNEAAITLQTNQLKQENQRLKSKLSSIRSKLSNLNFQEKKKQDVKENLKLQLEETRANLISGVSQNLQRYATFYLKIIDELQKDLQESMKKNRKYSQELNKAFAMVDDYDAKTQQLDKAKGDVEMLLDSIKEQDQKRQKEKAEEAEKVEKLNSQIQTLKKTNTSLKLEITEANRKQADAIRQNEELMKKISNQRDYERYFSHDVLYDYGFYKKAIINTIENRNYLNVKASRLLFKFDPLNKVNFHRYIDEIPHILVLVKLENGRMIACYTNQPFKPQCFGEDAFIMVLNTGNIYQLKKGMRAISYDEYYLLFGNSEIRLRSGENLIFSNFGIANSNFDNKNQNVDALFGEGKDKRELPITGYEIYQIIFEEER